jgi:hypothetical protein
MKGYHGQIEDFWSDYLQNFVYKQQIPYSGMRESWHENFDNGHLLQSFDDQLPPIWKNFQSSLSVSNGTVGWINIRPNQIIAPHFDHFYTLKQKLGTTIEHCVRYLIFLEDWKFGQYIEFEDLSIRKWKKGDVWYFDHTEEHWAVNASNFDFHTCQVNTIK